MVDSNGAEENRSIPTEDTDEDAEWERLTAEEFLKGYAECDAIYDELDDRNKSILNPPNEGIEEHP